ncbi:MAG TPA: response regulator transcription factor [Bacillota bacterium]|nr:response regulator transcription factor [Bacillota bacterium]
MNKIRLLVVDDHSLMRIGLATALNVEPDLAVVAEASSGEQALELYRRHKPDLVLMDLCLPGMSGDQATARLCREFSEAKVLMLSKHDGPAEIARCAQAGACSFLSKSLPLEELLRAIRAAHAGQPCVPSAPDIEPSPDLTMP